MCGIYRPWLNWIQQSNTKNGKKKKKKWTVVSANHFSQQAFCKQLQFTVGVFR